MECNGSCNGRYGTLNADLTRSFSCHFEFSCLVLQRGRAWEGEASPLKITKDKSKYG